MASEQPSWEKAARDAANVIKGLSGPWTITTVESFMEVMKGEMDDVIVSYYNDHPSNKLFPTSLECHLGTIADCALRILERRMGINTSVWMDKVVLLVAKKQHDYGHLNITRFGIRGLLVRLHDKYARLANLFDKDFDPEVEESVEDTLLDVVGYCLIGIMLDRGTFTLELSGELFDGRPKPTHEKTDLAAAAASFFGGFLG